MDLSWDMKSAFVLCKGFPQFLFSMYESICRAGWALKGVSKRHWEMHFWEFSSTSRTWLKHFREKRAAVFVNYSLWWEAVCLGGFRTQTIIPSLQIVKTLWQMAHEQQLSDFLEGKQAGSASPSSWYVWCLVNVSTWWGVTGAEWAVQSLTAKYFKAKILIYCSLEVKQLLNVWFWHQAWLCKDFSSKEQLCELIIHNLDMPGCFYITHPESIEFSYIHTYIHGFGAAVGHEVYLIRRQNKKRKRQKSPSCLPALFMRSRTDLSFT